jgi:hypothetical protein
LLSEEERAQEIRKVFLEYARQNELSAFNTAYYFAKQILPEEDLFLKMRVIENLKEAGIMQIRGDKWIIKE